MALLQAPRKFVGHVKTTLAHATRIAVLPPAHPDVDALGSALALCLALRARGKLARAFCDEAPVSLSFLPDFEPLVATPSASTLEALQTCDLLILCDTYESSQLGAWEKAVEQLMEERPA